MQKNRGLVVNGSQCLSFEAQNLQLSHKNFYAALEKSDGGAFGLPGYSTDKGVHFTSNGHVNKEVMNIFLFLFLFPTEYSFRRIKMKFFICAVYEKIAFAAFIWIHCYKNNYEFTFTCASKLYSFHHSVTEFAFGFSLKCFSRLNYLQIILLQQKLHLNSFFTNANSLMNVFLLV